MALRPRWIATQGLTIGLTPIVVAIQGLWPFEVDDEEDEPVRVFGGGGGGRVRASARDTHLARQRRLFAENMNRIAIICAAAVEEFFL